MMGIGVFGYMIGTIQRLFIGLQKIDENAEQQEQVNLWLIKLDKAMPKVMLSRKVFEDVRDFFIKKYKEDHSMTIQDPF